MVGSADPTAQGAPKAPARRLDGRDRATLPHRPRATSEQLVSSGADEHLPARTGGDPADIPDLGDPGGPAGFAGFPGLGGGDLSALMAQAQQMQQQLIEAQDELTNAEVTGTAGGGL